MPKSRYKNPIFLFYVLVFYIITQFTWWWYLIYSLNKTIFSEEDFLSKKLWMIIGEGLVFFIILIFGIISVKKAFKTQQNLTKKEENFLLSVGHELKTPIASAQLYLETLQKHKSISETDKEDIYKNTLSELKRLDNLVSNILMARQFDEEGFKVEKELIDVEGYLKTKIENFKNTFAKSHTIKFESEKISANIDTDALLSIATNLVENAVKYSPKSSIIEIKLVNKNNFFQLIVKDCGIGIAESNRKSIFQKFYREQQELSRKTKGTGLGLFIVKFFVDQHNGKIVVENNTPKGTIITVTLPKT